MTEQRTKPKMLKQESQESIKSPRSFLKQESTPEESAPKVPQATIRRTTTTALNNDFKKLESSQSLLTARWVVNNPKNRRLLKDYLIEKVIIARYSSGVQRYYSCCNIFIRNKPKKKHFSKPVDAEKLLLTKEQDSLIKKSKAKLRKKFKKRSMSEFKSNVLPAHLREVIKRMNLKRLDEFIDGLPKNGDCLQFPFVRYSHNNKCLADKKGRVEAVFVEVKYNFYSPDSEENSPEPYGRKFAVKKERQSPKERYTAESPVRKKPKTQKRKGRRKRLKIGFLKAGAENPNSTPKPSASSGEGQMMIGADFMHKGLLDSDSKVPIQTFENIPENFNNYSTKKKLAFSGPTADNDPLERRSGVMSVIRKSKDLASDEDDKEMETLLADFNSIRVEDEADNEIPEGGEAGFKCKNPKNPLFQLENAQDRQSGGFMSPDSKTISKIRWRMIELTGEKSKEQEVILKSQEKVKKIDSEIYALMDNLILGKSNGVIADDLNDNEFKGAKMAEF